MRPLNAPALNKNESDPTPGPQVVHLVTDNNPVDVSFDWHPLGSGPQFFDVSVGAAGGQSLDEATTANNHRVIMVDRGRPAYNILYVTGTVNADYKYLKSALLEDPQMQIVGIIREAKGIPKWDFIGRNADTVNAFFAGTDQAKDDSQAPDQPVLRADNYRDERERIELQTGFPTSPAKLYAYDAVILSKVEASFFTTDQLALLRRFVAERGGGLMMLGGVDSLDAGGYLNTPLASALPVYLDRKAPALPQGEMTWDLTREGWLEPWMRVRATVTDERQALASAPHVLVSNGLNGVKPGATVLASVTDETGTVFPAFIEQNYGSGRVACLTVGDMYEGRVGDADADDGPEALLAAGQPLAGDGRPRAGGIENRTGRRWPQRDFARHRARREFPPAGYGQGHGESFTRRRRRIHGDRVRGSSAHRRAGARRAGAVCRDVHAAGGRRLPRRSRGD